MSTFILNCAGFMVRTYHIGTDSMMWEYFGRLTRCESTAEIHRSKSSYRVMFGRLVKHV